MNEMACVNTEIYIHIPFCVKKCEYCDFLSMPGDERTQEEYVRAILNEIKSSCHRGKAALVTTIFIGGGTPSILKSSWIEEIANAVYDTFSIASDAEFTVECNPGTVDDKKLAAYKRAGVNRLSFGLQSADNRELKLLGRIHSYEDFLESFQQAREAGFDNINVDLMSALPGQSCESYRGTLEKVTALKPEHISAYSLIIEEETPFYERYAEDDRRRSAGENPQWLPTEEEERAMYELTENELRKAGYHRYEISNYAKPGYECRHNLGYWKRENYLGFGLGAASLFQNVRWSNTSDMKQYLRGEYRDEEMKLSVREQMEEFMFLGLRCMEGVSEDEFLQRFHVPMTQIYGDIIEKLCRERLLARRKGRIALTGLGIDVSNFVLAEFLLEES